MSTKLSVEPLQVITTHSHLIEIISWKIYTYIFTYLDIESTYIPISCEGAMMWWGRYNSCISHPTCMPGGLPWWWHSMRYLSASVDFCGEVFNTWKIFHLYANGTQNYCNPEKLRIKYVSIHHQHCGCRWPITLSMLRCLDIFSHSEEKL